MLPTTNVLQRTFLIKQGTFTGTAFACEWRGREYLVTARHVVQDSSASTEILHEEKWKTLPTTGIQHHSGADISVITLGLQLAPRHPVELTSGGISFGQDSVMLGFPFGWNYTQYDLNNGFPLPFIKGAILSAMMTSGWNHSCILGWAQQSRILWRPNSR